MPKQQQAATDAGLDRLIVEYMERVDAGEAVDCEQFAQMHPAYADRLRSYFADLNVVEQMAGPTRADAETGADPDGTVETHGGSAAVESRSEGRPRRKERRHGDGLPDDFGRYQVKKQLGAGAMGAVYLAHDTQLKRDVALKTPSFDRRENAEMVERFFSEARVAGTLNHANICSVYDVGEIDGILYISMAYINGHPLSHFVSDAKKLPARSVVLLVRKLAIALGKAHKQGVIHRDLKPDNIMMDGDKQPWIMDFGLARRFDSREQSRITQEGTILGTPAYMSPEQVSGERDVGPPSDIHSLGVILFELLTGELPYQGSMTAVIGQVLTQPPPKPSELRPDLDPRLDAICQKMMAKKVEDRYGSMEDAVRALTDFLKGRKQPAAGKEIADSPAAVPADEQQALNALFAAQACAATAPTVTHSPVKRTRQKAVPVKALIERLRGVPPMAKWSAAATAVTLLLLWGIVLLVRGEKGTLRIEINSPDIVVAVNGDDVEIDGSMKEVLLDVREHRLSIKVGDAEIDLGKKTWLTTDGRKVIVKLVEAELRGDRFEIREGETVVLRVSLDSSKTNGDSPSTNAPNLAIAPFDATQARQHQLDWATHLGIPLETQPVSGAKMVLIPPGTFTMGDMKPKQAEIETAFYISATEVTVGEFRRFVEYMKYQTEVERDPDLGAGFDSTGNKWVSDPRFNWRNSGFPQGDDHPVGNVSRNDAVAFCTWLSRQGKGEFRLPTSAEWEYACRAGTTSRYYTGSADRSLEGFENTADASYNLKVRDNPGVLPWDDGYEFSSPVGTFKPNPFGLFDMHANVREIVATSTRGGSFATGRGIYLRSAHGYGAGPHALTGFRIVRDVFPRPEVAGVASDIAQRSTSKAESQASPDLTNAKRLLLDDFDDPMSGFGSRVWGDDKASNSTYENGRYVMRSANAKYWRFANGVAYPDFACELIGRIVEGQLNDVWGLEVFSRETKNKRDLRIGINRKGELIVSPGYYEQERKNGSVPNFGPVAHPAIKPGSEFNKLLVVLKDRQLQVFVNGTAVCPPQQADRDLTPCGLCLHFQSAGKATAEFERMTVWISEDAVVATGGETALPAAEASDMPAQFTNSIGMKFQLIPAGEFQMGRPGTRAAHPVKITRPFYMGTYEVTQSEYIPLMGKVYRYEVPTGGQSYDRLPARAVSRNAAVEFCRKLSELPVEKAKGHIYRLPTEAEWEYACRAGGDAAKRLTEAELDAIAWYEGNSEGVPHIVGLKKPNAFGLHDMLGNLSEWCSDWYAADYYRNTPLEDPKGPASGEKGVIRGATMNFPAKSLSTTNRWDYPIRTRHTDHGFRVVLEIAATQGVGTQGKSALATESVVLRGHDGPVLDAAFSPDGKWIVSSSPHGGQKGDATSRLWSLDTAEQKSSTDLDGSIVAWTPDGSKVVLGYGAFVKVWDPHQNQRVAMWNAQHKRPIEGIALTTDGTKLMTASQDKLAIWEMSTQKEVQLEGGDDGRWEAAAFSRDGTLAHSFSDGSGLDGTVIESRLSTWELSDGQQRSVRTLRKNGSRGTFSPDGRRLLYSTWNAGSANLVLVDVESGHELRVWEDIDPAPRLLALSPDGQLALSAGSDHTLRLWNTSTGSLLAAHKGHTNRINALKFSRDSQFALSASHDKTVRIWRLPPFEHPSNGAAMNADRAAAIWALSLPRISSVAPVHIRMAEQGNYKNVGSVDELPAGRFHVTFLDLLFSKGVHAKDVVRSVEPLERLSFLRLKGSDAISPQVISVLARKRSLSTLGLSDTGSRIGDSEAAQLSGLRELTYLSMSGCNLTDAGLAKLSSLKKMTTLWVNGTRISDAGLPTLQQLPALALVGLSDCDVGDEGLRHLRLIEKLNDLQLRNNSRITDSGLVEIGNMPQLEVLNLSGTKITDDGISHLARLKKLRVLHLGETSVTAGAAERLSQSLPNLTTLTVGENSENLLRPKGKR